MRCREWNPTREQIEIIRQPLYMQLFNSNWPLNHKSLKDKMCGLNVVCSRGGSGETSKTRRCVELHKSFFLLRFSAPLLANKFAYCNMGIIFVQNCNECIWLCLARKRIFKHYYTLLCLIWYQIHHICHIRTVLTFSFSFLEFKY